MTRQLGLRIEKMKMETENGWTRVASLKEVEPGGAKAVRVGEGRSIALFNVEGRIYATDNQCPHMGFPLTRGVIRNGVLTCGCPRQQHLVGLRLG